jgi:hypothetical protein
MSSRFRAAPSRRATTGGRCLLVAVAIAAGVSGCGGPSAATLARQAATEYVSDLQSGDATDACSLETAETVRLQNHFAALESRFSSGARSPCGLEAFAGPSFDPSITPTNTTVNGDTASVAFAGGGTEGEPDNQLRRAASRHPRQRRAHQSWMVPSVSRL